VESNIKEGSFIKGKDGKDIFLYCWDNVSQPRAVIQIFHGMAEHAGRYKAFAEYLNSKGFIVYAHDHRGHGRTAGVIEELGYIGEDGFNAIVEDEHIISELIKKRHKDLPIIVFGHSFGSFTAQEYIIRYGNEIKGVILSGSAARRGIEVRAGNLIAAIERSIFGDKKKSKLIDYLSFNGYNKRIKNNKYKFEWLSCDLEEVRKYEADPFCGTLFTIGFFYYFFKGMLELYKKDRLEKVPKDLPILIISGEEDPVGNYGELVNELYKVYKAIGIKNLNIKLYSGKRHELHNEINREEVFEDLLLWINNCIRQ
jgi:alpha-beta hydrolase superfamily lysophospholipase